MVAPLAARRRMITRPRLPLRPPARLRRRPTPAQAGLRTARSLPIRRPALLRPRPYRIVRPRPGRPHYPPRPYPGWRPPWRPPWRYPWRWRYRVSYPPRAAGPNLDIPGLTRLQRAARLALWRRGYLRPVWIARLRRAGPLLTAFINRFYQVAGFEQILRAYYDTGYGRQAALLAIRLANRLARGHAGYPGRMSFQTSLVAVPGGALTFAPTISWDTARYLPLPWNALDPLAVRQLARQTSALSTAGMPIRWVFDSRRLRLPPIALLTRLVALLAPAPAARPLLARRLHHPHLLI